MAQLSLRNNTITRIISFGYKDHSVAGNGLDASDKDDAINITSWPNLFGMYQPDALTSFIVNGENYIITANEGDARDYDGFSEEERVKDLILDPDAFTDAETLQDNANLGRLGITTTLGDVDNDGDHDELYSYGTRSFSIWKQRKKKFKQVYDSGNLLEQITASVYPEYFNSSNDDNDDFDKRSDNKGPEPEGVTHGIIKGRHFVFVGLERIGGIMVFDVSTPETPEFIQYVNNRNFTGDPEAGTAGDLGPEGIAFIPALDSPTGNPMLAVANEVSGTTSLFDINVENLADTIHGDINNDGDVNRKDMSAMRPYLGQSASVFAECDLDDDGWITFRDMRQIFRLMR